MRTLFSILFLSAVHTTTIADTNYAQRLMRAQNPKEILTARSQYESRQVLRLACHEELSRTRAPLSCFELLRLDQLEKRSSREAIDRLRADLIKRCEQAAESLSLSVKQKIPSAIPTTCRQQLLRAQKILAYKSSRHWPEY